MKMPNLIPNQKTKIKKSPRREAKEKHMESWRAYKFIFGKP